jgi:hypothetical protein
LRADRFNGAGCFEPVQARAQGQGLGLSQAAVFVEATQRLAITGNARFVAGQAAGVAAGEIFAAPRAIAVDDLFRAVLPYAGRSAVSEQRPPEIL